MSDIKYLDIVRFGPNTKSEREYTCEFCYKKIYKTHPYYLRHVWARHRYHRGFANWLLKSVNPAPDASSECERESSRRSADSDVSQDDVSSGSDPFDNHDPEGDVSSQ